MRRLADKVVIVTGSSSGIGKAIALRFGQEGAKVIVAARRYSLCEQTVAQIQEAGGEAFPIQTDVADELVDASKEDILASKKIDPFDIAETAVYLATLGPHTIVRQIVIDRMGADW